MKNSASEISRAIIDRFDVTAEQIYSTILEINSLLGNKFSNEEMKEIYRHIQNTTSTQKNSLIDVVLKKL